MPSLARFRIDMDENGNINTLEDILKQRKNFKVIDKLVLMSEDEMIKWAKEYDNHFDLSVAQVVNTFLGTNSAEITKTYLKMLGIREQPANVAEIRRLAQVFFARYRLMDEKLHEGTKA